MSYSSSHYRSARDQALRMFTWSGFKGSYREALRAALKLVRHAEAEAAEEAAYLASLPPVPEDVEAEAEALRTEARMCPVTAAGNAEFRERNNRAQDLIDGARGFI